MKYTKNFINQVVRVFLNKKFSNKEANTESNDESQTVYLKLPYFGEISSEEGRKFKDAFKQINNKVNIKVVFCTRKLKEYFSLKDKVSKLMRARVVYEFKCLVDPDISYIGKTKRRLQQRILEHGKNNSAIKEHINNCEECQNNLSDCFQIKYGGRSDFEIQVVEAILISQTNPKLNRTLGNKGASYFLNVFK